MHQLLYLGSRNIKAVIYNFKYYITFHNTLVNTFSVFPQASTPLLYLQYNIHVFYCVSACLFTVPAIP